MNKSLPSFIAFGANLSNPKETFQNAVRDLLQRRVAFRGLSSLWQSPAWPPGSGQPDYVNGCAEVEFHGSAEELLDILHSVEHKFGRVRTVANAARPLDLDLLDHKGLIKDNADIILPHPRMADRSFVLLPLSELCPDWRHPVLGENVWRLIGQLLPQDVLSLRRLGPWQMDI